MPRLKGKQSNQTVWFALGLVLLVISVAIPLEYFGVTNLVASLGASQGGNRLPTAPITANEAIDNVEKLTK